MLITKEPTILCSRQFPRCLHIPSPCSHLLHSTSSTHTHTLKLKLQTQPSTLKASSNTTTTSQNQPPPPNFIKTHFSSTNMSRRSTNAMSRDSASALSRSSSSRSRGADSRDGYSHHSSSRTQTHSSRHTSRGYDDDSHSPVRSDDHSVVEYGHRTHCPNNPHMHPHFPHYWACSPVCGAPPCDWDPSILAEGLEHTFAPYEGFSCSNGCPYGRDSADYSSSRGASVSRSHSSRSGASRTRQITHGESRGSSTRTSTHGERRGSSTRQITHGESRGPSSRPSTSRGSSTRQITRGESRAPSSLPRIHEEGAASESRASGTASRLLARITGGQSSGGHSSSHAGRELARRY